MQILQNALIPALLAGISLYALCNGVDVFPTFLRGAAVGLKTAVQILPVMVGMLTVVFMLRASGAVDIAASVLAPALRILGIPKECTALTLLSRSAEEEDWRWAVKLYDAADRTAMPDAWPQ